MKKMVMTEELANELMEVLACVAISANGGCPMENGEPAMSDEQMELIQGYAQNTFREILSAWEDDDTVWQIEISANSPYFR